MAERLYELLEYIEEPNQSACKKLIRDNKKLFEQAPGSRANHQAYPGGYLNHIEDCMVFGYVVFNVWADRLEQLPEEEKFSASDVLLVMFLHDLEKPWMYARKSTGIATKEDRAYFRANKIQEYGIQLEDKHYTALRQVEGIRDKDYDPNSRGFTPLGALCHMADLFSARIMYQ